MENIRLHKLTALTVREQQELLELFVQADFSELEDGAAWLNTAVANSVAAVGAVDKITGSLVGFARALGDGVSDCYIQDVTVHVHYRKRGIGKAMVEFLLQELASQNIDWVGLIATPGNADFYRRMGFEEMSGHTPMRLKVKP